MRSDEERMQGPCILKDRRAQKALRRPRNFWGLRTMELPRDEMAFRKQYEALLCAQEITTVFRPGNRLYPNWRGYIPGEVVMARVIERCGSDELCVAPLFNDTRIPIQITSLTAKPIDNIKMDDFCGSSPDVYDPISLHHHLQNIYRKPIECFDGVVTKITFEYLLPKQEKLFDASEHICAPELPENATEVCPGQIWCQLPPPQTVPAARGL